MEKKRALIPGSFDPITNGHYDLAIRAAAIFDEVYVVAFVNSAKKGRFTPEQRLAMLKAAFEGRNNIHCDLSADQLLCDYAMQHDIHTLVKGARGSVDFDYELSLSLINRSLEPSLDTIILPTKAEFMHISSTMVSELIRYGRDYTAVVPQGVATLIKSF